jgi:molybdopterin molybdotransferase
VISYNEALHLIRAEASALPAEPVALEQSLDRIVATAIISPEALPPFDNSAMDGFALCSNGAPLPAGLEIDIHGESAAGDANQRAGQGGFEIMTGARMPDGLDSVVPVEQVEVLATDDNGRPRRIRLNADVLAGQHVRRVGEDVIAGAEVIAAGTRIGAAHVGLMASLGIAAPSVVRRPRAALICTGRELLDAPGEPLAEGQIRNSNGPYLAARLREAGADVVLCETVGDEPDVFVALLQRALDAGCELIVSTGAVSMGRYDFVPQALQGLGARQVFHKVAIRPGKPLLFARLPDGALFFGLPGNPASSAVGMRFFVEPALGAMAGLPAERPLRLPLLAAARKKTPFRFFQKARLGFDGEGRVAVELLSGQESFRIRPLAQANAWAVLPEDADAFPAGTLIDVHGLGAHAFCLQGDLFR